MAAEAMGQGGAVFAAGTPGRDALILTAAYALTGKAPLPAPEVQEAALPTFVVTPEPETAAVRAGLCAGRRRAGGRGDPDERGLRAHGGGGAADAAGRGRGLRAAGAKKPLPFAAECR